jgi:hypothetical protein
MASKCATCGFRLRAEKNPKSLVSRLWRWHTKWCPGWKAYQKELAEQPAQPQPQQEQQEEQEQPQETGE